MSETDFTKKKYQPLFIILKMYSWKRQVLFWVVGALCYLTICIKYERFPFFGNNLLVQLFIPILLLLLLLVWISRKTINKMYSLLKIDFKVIELKENTSVIVNPNPELEGLYPDKDSFKDFKNKHEKYLIKWSIKIWYFLISVMVVGMMLYIGVIRDGIIWNFGDTPEFLTYDMVKNDWVWWGCMIVFIFWYIYWITGFTSWIAQSLTLLNGVRVTINNYAVPIEIDERGYPILSHLKYYWLRCKNILEQIYVLNLIGLLFELICGFMIIFWVQILSDQINLDSSILWLIFAAIPIILLDLIVFFLPQYGFHVKINEDKKTLIRILNEQFKDNHTSAKEKFKKKQTSAKEKFKDNHTALIKNNSTKEEEEEGIQGKMKEIIELLEEVDRIPEWHLDSSKQLKIFLSSIGTVIPGVIKFFPDILGF